MAVTIRQAMVWLSNLTSRVSSISVVCDDDPYIGCEIAALLAKSEIPVAFATVRPDGERYEAVYGFHSQEDADAALKLITSGGVKLKEENNPPPRMKRVA